MEEEEVVFIGCHKWKGKYQGIKKNHKIKVNIILLFFSLHYRIPQKIFKYDIHLNYTYFYEFPLA